MKNISQQAKRILSLVLTLALLLATVSVSVISVSAAEPEYTDVFTPHMYWELESPDGYELELAEANLDGANVVGYHPIKAGTTNEFVAGSLIYRSLVAFKDIQFITAYSDNAWIGTATFEASVDGKSWITLETVRTADGNPWADAYSNVYDSVSFTEEQNIHFLKVTLTGNAVPQGPALREIKYSKYASAAEETYDAQLAPTDAISTESEGVLTGVVGAGIGQNFAKADSSLTDGTVTFAAPDLAPITDFSALMVLKWDILYGNFFIEVSQDGVNFKKVSPALEEAPQHFYNYDWRCQAYNVHGSFDAAEGIRFVRFTVKPTIVTANSIVWFNYNAADIETAYANTLDLSSGTPSTGVFVMNSRGGWRVYTDETSWKEVDGNVVYKIEEGISSFEFQTSTYPGLGTVEYFVSTDGVNWVKPKTTDTKLEDHFGMAANGNQPTGMPLIAHRGALLPGDGYKYVKFEFSGGNGATPVVAAVKYNTASQTGFYNPEADSAAMKDTYEVTMTPQQATASGTGTLKSCVDAGFGGWSDCANYYLFADADNNWVSGTLDFYSGKAITDYRFNLFDDNSASHVEVYGSPDGVLWIPLSENLSSAGASPNPESWGTVAPWYLYGTLEESANIHYIRLDMSSGVGFLKFPAVKSFELNNPAPAVAPPENPGTVVDSMADSYENTLYPNAATPTSTGTLKNCVDAGFGGWSDCASYYLFADADNNWVSGTLDFYSEKAITDFRFTLFDDSTASHVEIYASVDGVAWAQLDEYLAVAGESPNPANWGEQLPRYLYGSLKESADIHYVRISLTSKDAFLKFPAVRSFEYNNPVVIVPDYPGVDVDSMVDIYEKTIYPTEATQTSNGTLMSCLDANFGGWGECAIYYLFADSNKNWVPGTLDFYSEKAITDYRFTLYDDSTASNVEVYASVDGTSWIQLNESLAVAGESPNPANWGEQLPRYLYGSLKNTADIHYIRISLKSQAPFLKFPAVRSFEYNDVDTVIIEKTPVMKDRYEYRVAPNEAHDTESTHPLTNVYGIGDNLTYDVYVFWDMDRWTGGDPYNAWFPGTIDYYSEEAITDYRVKGIWSGVDGDAVNVYGSSDGESWKKLSPTQAEVGDFSNPNWGSFTSKWYYGSFRDDADIHYIRVELASTVTWLPFLPGICFVDYNTISYDGKPDRPENYVNTSLEENYFLQDDQFITFKSGSATTDFDLWLKPINGQTPKIYLSRDNSNWDESVAVSEEVGDGVYSYYDALRSGDGIQYIKIDKSTAEFVQLRYNIGSGGADTTRRHYEMPEIVDDIEDLELDSVRTPFKEYNTVGVVEFYDMSITGNGTNADFIGGEFGLLGHADVSSVLMDTPNVRDFKIVAAFGVSEIFSHIKAYGRTSVNGLETEIPLMRAKTEDFASHGFGNYVFRPVDREALVDAGYHFIRIELAQEYIFMQQVLDFVYFYELPELVPMPDFRKPDASKGEIELMDVFDSAQLTTADDGKAETALQLHKDDVAIGRNNPGDRVIVKDYYMAESFIVYKVPDLKYFDIRVYKSAECNTDLVISVSSDGENWKQITVDPLERDIYDGWRKAAYQVSGIESGMHYIKIEIPDLDGVETDLMISDIQLIHTSTSIPEILDDTDKEADDSEEEIYEDDYEEEYIEDSGDEIYEDEEPVEDGAEEEEKKNGKKKVVKVVKRIRNTGLNWWQWTLIAVGGLAVIGAGLAVFFIVRAKKRKKDANVTPEA